jgi:hypothetical protein
MVRCTNTPRPRANSRQVTPLWRLPYDEQLAQKHKSLVCEEYARGCVGVSVCEVCEVCANPERVLALCRC